MIRISLIVNGTLLTNSINLAEKLSFFPVMSEDRIS